MKSIKQQKHLERLNSIPRTKEWGKHISESLLGKKGKFLECTICKKSYYKRLSLIKIKNYCSNSCRFKGLVGRKITEEQKRILSTKNKEFWNSERGKKVRSLITIRGEKNWNWKGGTLDYWKPQIFERDNRTCQKCGLKDDTKGFMEVDHIKPKSKFPELKNSPDNMMTLCPNCHKRKSLKERL